MRPTPVRDAGPIRIGIVDDDISFREALAGWLGSYGYPVRAFASADAFLRSGRPDEFDCLCLDVRMPGMSGLELQARMAGQRPAVPIIFISSQDDPATRARALAAGAVGFFSKPIDCEALIALVGSVASEPALTA